MKCSNGRCKRPAVKGLTKCKNCLESGRKAALKQRQKPDYTPPEDHRCTVDVDHAAIQYINSIRGKNAHSKTIPGLLDYLAANDVKLTIVAPKPHTRVRIPVSPEARAWIDSIRGGIRIGQAIQLILNEVAKNAALNARTSKN